jgi:hypothetical protein
VDYPVCGLSVHEIFFLSKRVHVGTGLSKSFRAILSTLAGGEVFLDEPMEDTVEQYFFFCVCFTVSIGGGVGRGGFL